MLVDILPGTVRAKKQTVPDAVPTQKVGLIPRPSFT